MKFYKSNDMTHAKDGFRREYHSALSELAAKMSEIIFYLKHHKFKSRETAVKGTYFVLFLKLHVHPEKAFLKQ